MESDDEVKAWEVQPPAPAPTRRAPGLACPLAVSNAAPPTAGGSGPAAAPVVRRVDDPRRALVRAPVRRRAHPRHTASPPLHAPAVLG